MARIEPLEARIAPATFTVLNINDSGLGSLRNAIISANGAANGGGPDLIVFNLGTGPFTISPFTALPDITEAVTIDGYSQASATVNTLAVGTNANIVVELNGAQLSSGNGLVLAGGGGSTVKGLAIFAFGDGSSGNGSAIVLKSGGNKVTGNFLGVNKSGAPQGNASSGVAVGDVAQSTPLFTGNIIGGTMNADRNLIAGNKFGVALDEQAVNTVIFGNLIGTDKTGSAAQGNVTAGIKDTGSAGTSIGDGSVAGRNVISGNSGHGVATDGSAGILIRNNYIGIRADGSAALGNSEYGIWAAGGATGGLIEQNVVSGNSSGGIRLGEDDGPGHAQNFNVRSNFIGTNPTGMFGIPNNGHGILFDAGSFGNVIGGTAGGQGNVIAFNAGAGIHAVNAGGDNRFYGNSIVSNGGLGINLGGLGQNFFGVALNDSPDLDGVTNWPQLQTFNNTGAAVTLNGVLNAHPGKTYRVEFFAMAPGQVDASGHGEGAVYLGFQDFTTNNSGVATLVYNQTISLPTDSAFSATATPTGGGSTSEFGPTVGVARTFTWNGSAGQDWLNPQNWTPNGVPGALDSATLGAGFIALNAAKVSVKTFNFTGGTLGGTNGEVDVLGTFTWTGGTHADGTLRLTDDATGTINGSTPLVWNGGSLDNRGTLTVQNAGLSFNKGFFYNSTADGLLTLLAGVVDTDGSAAGSVAEFYNDGTVVKSGAGAFGMSGIAVNNSGTLRSEVGTFVVETLSQFSGMTELAGGNFSTPNLFQIFGGDVVGSGTITGTVDNSGRIFVGGKDAAGTLTIAGGFTQGAGGRIVVDLGGLNAGTQYDQLVVQGTATLGGTLEQRLLGTFSVRAGNQFTVVTGVTLGGAFSVNEGLPAVPVTYTSTQAILSATGFTVTNTNDGGTGSLRDAIIAANTQPGLDYISFNIAGSGVKTIAPLTALPALGGDVVIDGYTQNGAQVNTLAVGSDAALRIELSGVNLGPSQNGLTVSSGKATISGLIINRWAGFGVAVGVAGGGVNILGNWIGPDSTGNAAPVQGQGGISVEASNVTIGSAAARNRNVISGNGKEGINVLDGSASGTLIRGNYIGTNPAGNAMLGNGGTGISTVGPNTFIGGDQAGEGNVISASAVSGIVVSSGTAGGTVVYGNSIGTDATGILDFGNVGDGVLISSAPNILIGSTSLGARNIIAGNGGAGINIISALATTVYGNFIGTNVTGNAALANGLGISINGGTGSLIGDVDIPYQNIIAFNSSHGITVNSLAGPATANYIRGNSIHSNGGLGINLVAAGDPTSGVTANDALDADSGANALLNFPVLGSYSAGANPTVTGTYSGVANTTFLLDFYGSPSGDPSGNGEGRFYMSTFTVTTNSSGDATFAAPLNVQVPAGGVITATATDLSSSNTSEFSAILSTSITRTWDAGGGANTDWFNAVNWSGDVVPGAGDIAILNTNATISLSGSASVFTFTQSTGTLSGTGTLTVVNNFDWSGGTQDTSGGITSIAVGGTLNMSGNGIKTLQQRTLNNAGTVIWTGTGDFLGHTDPVINNSGLFDIQTDADITRFGGNLDFNNLVGGTLLKSAGAAETATDITFNNAGAFILQAGSVSFLSVFTQTAGATVLNGGNVSGTTLTLDGGIVSGSGTVTANVLNNGATLVPGGAEGIGTITITGNYTQGAGGSLVIETSGPGAGNSDHLAVSGTATLDGTLVINILSFTPAIGDVFSVLTAGTRSGTFANIAGDAAALSATYTATTVELARNAINFTWDGDAGDNDWFNSINWSPDAVPTAGDSVELDAGDTVSLNGGNASIVGFVQTGGTFTGAGTLTVSDTFQWTGGSQTGAGETVFGSTAIALVAGNTSASRSFTNFGRLTLMGTSSFGTFTQNSSSAALVFSNASTSGSFTLNGGSVSGIGTHISGDFTNNGAVIRPGGLGTIGTLGVNGFSQGSTATLEIDIAGASAGQFDVLALTGASTLGGGLGIDTIVPFNPGVGNTFRVITAPAQPSGNFATFAGDVTRLVKSVDSIGVLLTSNTLTYIWDNSAADGDWFNPLNWNLDSGLPGPADTVIINTVTTVNLPSSVSISALEQSNGVLGGGGSLIVTDALTWSGGTIGLLFNTGISSNNTLGGTVPMTLDGAVLNLAGTTTLSGALSIGLTGANAELRNSGAFTFTSDAGITGTGVFHNVAGSAGVSKTGPDQAILDVAFLNGSALNILDGVFALNGGGSWLSDLTVTVSANAVFEVIAGTYTFQERDAFVGAGTTHFHAGAFIFNGDEAHIGLGHTLEQFGGTLSGTADLIVAGTFQWSGGLQAGPGETIVTAGGLAYLSGSDPKSLDLRVLRVAQNGSLIILGDGSVSLANGSRIVVGGTMDVSASAAFNDAGGAASGIDILATGAFVKSDAGATMISVPFTNAGSVILAIGAVNFLETFTQTSGSTVLGGGVGFSTAADFKGGTLSGNGTITGSIDNSGATVSPGASPGVITITGDYTQGPGGMLDIQIGGFTSGTQFDRLVVNGNVSLDGLLNVTLGFAPVRGDEFAIITGSSFSGTFASTSIPPDLVAIAGATSFRVLFPFLPPGLIRLVDIDGTNGFTIPALSVGDLLGVSVTGLGDINGDGLGDFAVGGANVSTSPALLRGGVRGSVTFVGATYVVFGQSGGFGASFDLSTLDGTNGFVILGEANGDRSGQFVRGAGDINQDGVSDIIVGAPGNDAGGSNAGAAYVIFGRTTAFDPTVSLSLLSGSDGFKITGIAAGDQTGFSVSGIGDVNNDGKSDILIGVPTASVSGPASGVAYVIFGGQTQFPPNVDVSELDGTTGFMIFGHEAGDRFGDSVAGGGDFNGDGFADFIIGAPGVDTVGFIDAGAAYVFFGRKGGIFPAAFDVTTLDGKTGFKIEGIEGNEGLGVSVAAAGDMNGDGFSDILIGAINDNGAVNPIATPFAKHSRAYVIFGKAKGYTAALNLNNLTGANGFLLLTEQSRFHSGVFVSSAGDFNGDGFSDILIGAPDSGKTAGMTYLMYGRKSGYLPELELDELNGTNGLRFLGTAANSGAGFGVGGGDVNGDGAADIFIGAPNDQNGGTAYVIFGNPDAVSVPVSGSSGTTLTFSDEDDDTIIIKVTGGKITADMLTFGPDGGVQLLDLTAGTFKDGANITFSVKKGATGNGIINVGAINAEGIKLGTVKISGDLGQIDAGDGSFSKPGVYKNALKQLIVGSLGAMGASTQLPGTEDPLVSEINGALPKLIVKGAFTNATFNVLGKLGTVTIGGSLTGTGAFDTTQLAGLAALGYGQIANVSGGTTLASSGITAGSIGKLTVTGALSGSAVKSSGSIGSATIGGNVNKSAIAAAGPLKIIKVLGSLIGDATTPSVFSAVPVGKSPTAINKLTIRGNVSFAEILVGYDTAFLPVNGDAGIGTVTITGNFTASSIVAGIKDDTANGFGVNDIHIPGFDSPVIGTADKILSKIASLTIKGSIEGTPGVVGDSYGITAQKIGKAKIAGVKVILNKLLPDNLGFGTDSDVRLVEVF